MTLSADVRVTRAGDFTLSAAVSAPAGTVTALLGPNGAGKSTLLRVLAGLLPLDAGRVVLDGTVYDDPTAGVLLPPERRPVGVVFQDYLLFPHLTALDNVAFGPRCRGLSRARSRQVAQEWLDRVGLGDLAGRRPRRLSGGQAQRVALARALATEPRLLLLDEPLAALDAGTRMRIRTELRRHLDDFGGVAVLVTHDPLDAMVLADQVVVLEEGRVVQCGAPREIATRPASRYVADLVGVNLVPGRGLGGDRVALDGCALTLPGAPVGDVLVAFPRPRCACAPWRRPTRGGPGPCGSSAWSPRWTGSWSRSKALPTSGSPSPPAPSRTWVCGSTPGSGWNRGPRRPWSTRVRRRTDRLRRSGERSRPRRWDRHRAWRPPSAGPRRGRAIVGAWVTGERWGWCAARPRAARPCWRA
ncbi:ABC transporter ATP-binding protein [Actinoalloteichus caeruleus]|uniref:Molybdate transport system ATP-binding protein n=1 Tax=Actinoalloteichus caeruleus DSM 43889 TaxID=1120930 RepID=A0ABT1JNQ8_ACTCY|nr:ABC transporter ATP-binding protein [Actinoalloteichus caeruleus]MCP2334162.1 molybdate transport system ATP-binding protein [Actinoalloteichus caeruleus DSM 43889]